MVLTPAVSQLIDLALSEDLGLGDLTTTACIPAHLQAEARIETRQALVLCGLPFAAEVFRRTDPDLALTPLHADGAALAARTDVLAIRGSARAILMAERTALNFLQHLSGIATLTARFRSRAAEGNPATRVCDTRKTLPGWRALAKYAVRCGGGHNHRHSLADAVMIKDNHIAAAGSIKAAVQAARGAAPHTATIEVEADTLAQVDDALAAGADIILLDNMNLAQLREAVARVAGRARTEASGGVTLDTIAAIAATGVDVISVGALTHSAPASDLSLELQLLS